MNDSSFLITGGNGQLGKALKAKYPGAKAVDIDELDIADRTSVEKYKWEGISLVLNAAAYTNVDGAETPEGRISAWQANALAVANLIRPVRERGLSIVHISTDYVFDGTMSSHTEKESFSPLSVYGASKAAGDLIVSGVDKHYILRTSWVIGDGKNFVRTMLELGQKGINPSVVCDQIGRLTFTGQLVAAIDHLLTKQADFGTYNISNSGDAVSWAEITRAIYKEAGLANEVSDITTAEYYKGKDNIATRPLQSTLDLSKIESTGFKPKDWRDDLQEYVTKELSR